MVKVVWGHKNRAAPIGSPELATGPYVRSRDPAPDQVDVVAASNVLLTVASVLPRTVVLASIVITFSVNGAAPVTVYSGSAFQAGYNGTATHNTNAIEDYFDFVINPDADFPSNAAITVAVLAQDDLGGDITPPESYTFFIAFTQPVPPPVVIEVSPNNDTIRGGKQIFIAAESLVDTSEDQSFARVTALPAGWASAGTVVFDDRGLELRTGPAAGGSASVTNTTAQAFFDAAVDVELIAPTAIGQGAIEVASFRHTAGGDEVALVVTREKGLLRIQAEATAFGRVLAGGATYPASAEFTLRVIRDGARIFAFVDDVQVLASSQFSSTAGTTSFGVANNDRAVAIRTLFSNFRITSHVLIGPRLLVDKELRFGRLVGNVPAATLAEVGFADVTVFGLFGEAVAVDGFLYTLPPPRTISRDRNGTLLSVQDPALKDGT